MIVMNRIFSLLFALLGTFPLLAQENSSESDPFSQDAMTSEEMLAKGFKRYQVEKGIIHYELTGTEKGTLVVYFDRWGLREAQYKNSEMKVFGIKQKTNTVSYLDGENMYNYTPEENTYMRIKNTLVRPVTEDMGEGDMTVGGKKLLTGMGGEQTGQETVMGKNCELWELKSMKMKNWIWKGISLKMYSKLLGVTTDQTATKIEIDVEVPGEKVTLPESAKSVLKSYGY